MPRIRSIFKTRHNLKIIPKTKPYYQSSIIFDRIKPSAKFLETPPKITSRCSFNKRPQRSWESENLPFVPAKNRAVPGFRSSLKYTLPERAEGMGTIIHFPP